MATADWHQLVSDAHAKMGQPVNKGNPPNATPSQMGAVITSGDSEGVTKGYQQRSDELQDAKKKGKGIKEASQRLKRQQNVAANRPANEGV